MTVERIPAFIGRESECFIVDGEWNRTIFFGEYQGIGRYFCQSKSPDGFSGFYGKMHSG